MFDEAGGARRRGRAEVALGGQLQLNMFDEAGGARQCGGAELARGGAVEQLCDFKERSDHS